MCTAVTYFGKSRCFGRNLDLEYSYGEQVTLAPRRFPLQFRCLPLLKEHYALLGMAHIAQGYPLYYDAMNEMGLAMAGLNFPGYAAYYPYHAGVDNVTPFELIPWVLGQCADLAQVKALLGSVNLLDQDFSPELPLTPLHWMAADRTGAVVIEPMGEGLRVFNAPAGVLTNAPPFDWQMTNLSQYMALSNQPPENRFAPGLELAAFSRGMGAVGLPGDLSSPSRFVRACFLRENSPAGLSQQESIHQLFHILRGVAQVRGSVILPGGGEERTVYTACCDLDRGLYCYTTYENSRVTGVDLFREALDGGRLVKWPLRGEMDILWENG